MSRRTIVVTVVLTLVVLVALAAAGTWLIGGYSGSVGTPAGPDADVDAGEDTTSADPDADAGPAEAPSPPRPSEIPEDAEAAIVDRVVDGDTIRVVAAPGGSIPEGGSIRVRLLNVDTPELARGGNPAECGAQEATARVEELVVSGDLVWLVADREDRDRFDRPLRGVWLADGTFLNELLAEEGYAEAVLFPPNDRFHARIEAAVDRAREAGRGIWGEFCPS